MSSQNISSEVFIALIVASTSILVALIGHVAARKKNIAEIENINAQTKKIIMDSKKTFLKPERKSKHKNFKPLSKKKKPFLLYGFLVFFLPLLFIFLVSHGNQENN